MRTVVSWCLDHRSVVILAAVAILAAGVYAGANLKRELMPPVDLPLLTISTVVPGSDPESIDEEVTRPIERAVAGTPGLKSYNSSSSDGFSFVFLEYELSVDVKEAETEIERALDEAQLPETAQTPRISRINMMEGDSEFTLAVIAGKNSIEDLTDQVQDAVVPLLRRANGVAGVKVTGTAERRVEVRVDPKELAANGIPLDQVTGALRANNLSLPVGAVTERKLSVPVRVAGKLESVRELENLVVGVSPPAASLPPQPVHLKDIARVEVATGEGRSISRANGKPSLGIEISKERDANAIEFSRSIRDVLPEIRNKLEGNSVVVVMDSAEFIQDSINDLIDEALVGALLVILIIFFFLRSVRATLIVAISIPTSVLAALVFAWGADLSLHILTLTGLTIAVGRVIDDAIVVLENIFTRMQAGEPAKKAALEGTVEVSQAIASSTFTAVAVFLPIGLVGGIVSKFFLSFSLIVALALLASLLVSITLVPVLAHLLLRKDGVRHGEGAPLLKKAYTPLLGWALRHRGATVVIGFLVFVGSLALLPRIPQNLMPDSGSNELRAVLQLPDGTDVSETSRRIRALERFLNEEEKINLHLVRAGGEGSEGSQGANTATVWMRLDKEADVGPILKRLRERGEDLYGDQFRLNQIQYGPGGGRIQVVMTNPDFDKLERASRLVMERLKGIDHLENLESSLSKGKPEFSVRLDQDKATQAGLTAAQVASTVRGFLHGQEVGEVPANGQSLSVYVSADRDQVGGPSDLEALPVGMRGGPKLGDIAEVKQVTGPVSIVRSDGARSATITGRMATQDTGGVSKEIEEAIAGMSLPSGTETRLGGENEDMEAVFGDMGIAMVVAILLVYLVLVIFFGSLLHPLTIILSLPLASIGALGALLISGQALGMPALIGILMLIGIVVSNAILLVDFIQKARKRGQSRMDAEMAAGRRRVRPILMTAIVTIGALTPLAMGLSGGILISASLATVVIGGLATSTLLTLVVIPSVYSLLDAIRARIFGEPETSHFSYEDEQIILGEDVEVKEKVRA